MQWGRKQDSRAIRKPAEKTSEISRGAHAVIITGALICTLFFTAALSGIRAEPEYPAAMATAAQSAFYRDHAALVSVLGIDEYFPEEAVYTGTFGIAEEGERWSFSQYLRDAFRTMLFGGGE